MATTAATRRERVTGKLRRSKRRPSQLRLATLSRPLDARAALRAQECLQPRPSGRARRRARARGRTARSAPPAVGPPPLSCDVRLTLVLALVTSYRSTRYTRLGREPPPTWLEHLSRPQRSRKRFVPPERAVLSRLWLSSSLGLAHPSSQKLSCDAVRARGRGAPRRRELDAFPLSRSARAGNETSLHTRTPPLAELTRA